MLLGKLPPVREEWAAASFFYCEIKQKSRLFGIKMIPLLIIIDMTVE